MFKLRKNKKGFTLVELMIVVIIIGILTAIAIPVYNSVTANAKINSALANQRSIDSAIQMYYAKNSKYPDNINALVPDFIQSIPEDPFGASYDIGVIKVVIGGTEDNPITEDSYVCIVNTTGVDYPEKAILHPIT
ncbi:MAG: prepilin-type N-terminal cleavage/methylation domain-containing protein [Clostridiales bacterium]|nr:prepilin-type N-terminal cleavage/methylation domain-containing protein [Clostridiales bacterium]